MSVRGAFYKTEAGAQITFDEYGDPDGTPVIFCHGWPSSRSMAELTDGAARELGVRIISPDRPGISGSTFIPGRELLDWPPLVRELAAHLSLGRFRLLAISGGAPYAYATAWALRDQVEAVAIVSGAPPIAGRPDRSGLLRLYRWMLALHATQPALLRMLFHAARPFASTPPPLRLRPVLLKLLQPCDAAVLRDSAAFDSCFESARRAWRGSARGVVADAEIYSKPWGFELREVGVPVRLWHGTKDRTFSVRVATEVAAQIPNCNLRIIQGAGHYSLPIRHIGQILQDLCAPTLPVGRVPSG
ncbi:MAG: alpha/beta hydrolase [Chthoniobacterales bacterium]|nr:alpha/beta hydrolase [Chthoniobacterales bacterium]